MPGDRLARLGCRGGAGEPAAYRYGPAGGARPPPVANYVRFAAQLLSLFAPSARVPQLIGFWAASGDEWAGQRLTGCSESREGLDTRLNAIWLLEAGFKR
jgi:hypothetical protein